MTPHPTARHRNANTAAPAANAAAGPAQNMAQTAARTASKTTRPRLRMMAWSAAFIVCAALLLPAASYLLPAAAPEAHAQVAVGENNRANFWRAVREGAAGYSAVSASESGMFINNGGQNWRQMRNGIIANYGGWAIIAALLALILFYAVRGKIPIEGEASGLTVPRWQTWERVMHWYTAALFVALAVTGLSMLFGRVVLIPVLGAPGFALWANFSINVHNIAGPFFTVGVLAMLVFWLKNNIPDAVDWQWLKDGGGIIGNRHPSAGKANGGEKIWFWLVVLVGLLAVCLTGLALINWLAPFGVGGARDTMQLMHQIHAIAALIWIVVFFGHAYIGTLGTEGALEGMTTGRVSVEWAKQHHDLWYEEVKHQAAPRGVESPAAKTSAAPAAQPSAA